MTARPGGLDDFRRRLTVTGTALADVVRNVDLRHLQLAWACSMTAEWAYFVALGVFAYREGGSLAVGIVGLVRMLPGALVTPLGAALGDRYRRRRVLLSIQGARVLCVAASAGAFAADAPAPVVYALGGLAGMTATLYWPTHYAIVPWLAKKPEEVVAANSASSTIEGLGTLAGPIGGGLLVSLTDPGVAFAATAATHLLACLALAAIRGEGESLQVVEDTGRTAAAEIVAGFKAIAREPGARLVVALFCGQSLVRGALNVLIVAAGLSLLGVGASGVGYLTGAIGVGGVAGALAAVALVGKRLAVPFGVGLVLWGLPIALIGAWPEPAVALFLLGVVGGGNAVLDVAGLTLLQRAERDEFLNRILGVLYGAAMGAVGLGSILVAPLISALGIRGALAVTGAFLPLLAVLAWRRLVALDRRAAAPQRELETLRRVPMFAPLPVAGAEQVARSLRPLRIAAGTSVVREGDAGDLFYILVEGEMEVAGDDFRVELHDEGEYFGEIALLRNVPRTATVTAVSDALVYALERDDFMRAVTGHAGGLEAGEAVVRGRLAALPGYRGPI
jgi:MFS family permease